MRSNSDTSGGDTADEPLRFDRLLDLAQNVLSGRGEQDILAGIADPIDRARFASAVWLEGANGESFEFWLHNLCNLLSDGGIDPSCLQIDRESICPCGRPLRHHREDSGMALEGQSRAWHLYGAARDLDPQVRRYRAEACFEHPRLLELVIREAYGAKGPASRRADAWRVLDDIDHRRPLIGALARFFRVGPAATRALRHWRPASLQYWLAYPSARRLSSMLVVLPTNDRRDLDERELWRWLLVAHVFIRCTGVTTEYVMRGEILDGIERLLSARPSGRVALHRTMRRAIRWLRQERREHGGFPRPSRLLAAIGVPAPQPAVLNFCFLLPDGWLGARLDTQEAIREEGAAMHHCLGRYVKDVMRGEVNAYTLRSSDGTERATLVTRHWPFNDDEDMALHITLKAFDNGPVHIGALEATLALIRMVAPATTRVEF